MGATSQPPCSRAGRRNGNLIASFRCAFEGVRHVLGTQRNARIHLGITVAVVALGLLLGLAPLEWAVIAAMVGLVLMAEMLNTSLEAVVDLACPDVHPLAKTAKDVAAGGVLIVAFAAVVVGLLILGPPLLALLQ